MKSSRADLLALLLALTAAISTAWVSDQIFERIPHVEDEYANLWQAEVIADGALYLPSPPELRAFLVPFVVDFQGLRFSKYPPGWSALLSLGSRAGATWLVNPILAGLAVWLIYRLGSKISGAGVGLLAALLAASSPMMLMLSGSLMSHPMSLFLGLAFTLSWLDLFPASRAEGETARAIPAWLLVAVCGVSLGLIVLTRPLTAIGVALPFGVHGITLLIRGDKPKRTRALAVAGTTLAVSALLPIWQLAVTGSPWINPYTLWWPYDKIGFGLGVGHTATGHNLQLALANLRFSLRAGRHDLFGWPYLSWLFMPFGLWALRRNRDGLMVAAVFPGLIFTYAFYWVGAWLFGPRYYYEALPGLSIMSAAGFAWASGWLNQQTSAIRWRRLVGTALLFTLLAANILFYIPARVGGMHGLFDAERAFMTPLEEAELGNALVFVHLQRSWKDYGTLLALAPPFRDAEYLLVIWRQPEVNQHLMESYPDRPVLHYYPDDEPILLTEPR